MDRSQVFLVVAALGGVLAVIGSVAFFRRHFSPAEPGLDIAPEPRSRIPPAPLQKRAWWGLVITMVTTIVVVAVLLIRGPSMYYADTTTRYLVLGVVLSGAVAYALLLVRTRLVKGVDDVVIDERDRMVLARAPAVQLYAVFISLVVWCIALTEIYWDRGAIPVFYPYLMFWTIYAVSIMAWSIGILIGYRRL